MRQFVESLKRLYDQKQIGEAVVMVLYGKQKITEAEKAYILHTSE